MFQRHKELSTFLKTGVCKCVCGEEEEVSELEKSRIIQTLAPGPKFVNFWYYDR